MRHIAPEKLEAVRRKKELGTQQNSLIYKAMANSKNKTLFQIHYRDPKDGQVVSLKVRHISDSTLGLSFVKISDFVFQTEGVLVQPSEEQMKKRLENVKSLHLSIYSIISIEELGEEALRFEVDKSNLVVLPSQKS